MASCDWNSEQRDFPFLEHVPCGYTVEPEERTEPPCPSGDEFEDTDDDEAYAGAYSLRSFDSLLTDNLILDYNEVDVVVALDSRWADGVVASSDAELEETVAFVALGGRKPSVVACSRSFDCT